MPNRPDLTIEHFMEGLIKRNPGEIEFHQAVQEVSETVIPFINQNPKYRIAGISDRRVDRICTGEGLPFLYKFIVIKLTRDC